MVIFLQVSHWGATPYIPVPKDALSKIEKPKAEIAQSFSKRYPNNVTLIKTSAARKNCLGFVLRMKDISSAIMKASWLN